MNPTTQCVKVDALRQAYPGEEINLEKWLLKPTSMYVGRRGRVFIKLPDNTNKVFVYEGSKWGNPYKVGPYTLEESLKLYRKYVIDSNLPLKELSGKVLGCFCDQRGPCHAKVLVELYTNSIDTITTMLASTSITSTPLASESSTSLVCTAINKTTGKQCTYKAKLNGLCGIHSK